MKTIDLEIALLIYFNFTRSLIVTNVTTTSGLVMFEADMIVLSQNGYAHGLELKVSKSDLRAEFKKSQYGGRGVEYYYKRFKYFSFAMPIELKEEALKLVPEIFGLYFVDGSSVTRYRNPKFLNNYKWSDKERYRLARLGAMRIFSLKNNISTLLHNRK